MKAPDVRSQDNATICLAPEQFSMKLFQFQQAAVVAALALTGLGATNAASAQTVDVFANGTLSASSSTTTIVNQLKTSASGATGFNFSGATGSFDPHASANNYFYAAYVIQTTTAIAESIATTLNNSNTGVSELSERIYAFNGTFLGDRVAGPAIVQKWSDNISLGGASISVIAPTHLTSGQYVLEIRGRTAGNFGGSVAISPVPEPQTYMLMLAGLGLLGLCARRQSKAE
ncbi:FxDxF family PEP-CTERM protein [Paucibacter sp. B2R-40]|uniref:FxDxF family PEP-CTERM protein n=1 Tax=Paucibacter sp. B2R-40 TaxID=2893554 RepID=UPI0021E4A698|nr:FxDxF family PEP-CTERM protein [Paucibacter sp. B2R-40]MCV2352883.1 FxDxF family PEP-CTERM protein [Paucibacter sp. B2R-40]